MILFRRSTSDFHKLDPIAADDLLQPDFDSVVSIYPHRLLAFSQNVRPGEGSVPTGPTTGKLQSLMTSRAEKGTQDLMR